VVKALAVDELDGCRLVTTSLGASSELQLYTMLRFGRILNLPGKLIRYSEGNAR
jgi:hypothetical protein